MRKVILVAGLFGIILLQRFGCTYKLVHRDMILPNVYIDTYRYYRLNTITDTYKKYLTDTLNYRIYLWRINDHSKTYVKRIDSPHYIICKFDLSSANEGATIDSLLLDEEKFKKEKKWDWIYNPF